MIWVVSMSRLSTMYYVLYTVYNIQNSGANMKQLVSTKNNNND